MTVLSLDCQLCCSQVPDPESPEVADHLDGSANKEGIDLIVGREMSTVEHL